MEEFFRLLASVGIEAAICDVPFDFAYNDFYLYLEQWGFTFELMDKDEVRVTVEKLIRIPQLLGDCASEVLPFCKASGKLQDDAIRGAEVNRLRLVGELSHELLEILNLGLMVGSVLP